MRYDTAVDRLHKIADACSDVSRFRVELTAAYVYGDLLAGADLEVVQVALAVDVPRRSCRGGQSQRSSVPSPKC